MRAITSKLYNSTGIESNNSALASTVSSKSACFSLPLVQPTVAYLWSHLVLNLLPKEAKSLAKILSKSRDGCASSLLLAAALFHRGEVASPSSLSGTPVGISSSRSGESSLITRYEWTGGRRCLVECLEALSMPLLLPDDSSEEDLLTLLRFVLFPPEEGDCCFSVDFRPLMLAVLAECRSNAVSPILIALRLQHSHRTRSSVRFGFFTQGICGWQSVGWRRPRPQT